MNRMLLPLLMATNSCKLLPTLKSISPRTLAVVLIHDDAILDGQVVAADIEAIGVVSCSTRTASGIGLIAES